MVNVKLKIVDSNGDFNIEDFSSVESVIRRVHKCVIDFVNNDNRDFVILASDNEKFTSPVYYTWNYSDTPNALIPLLVFSVEVANRFFFQRDVAQADRYSVQIHNLNHPYGVDAIVSIAQSVIGSTASVIHGEKVYIVFGGHDVVFHEMLVSLMNMSTVESWMLMLNAEMIRLYGLPDKYNAIAFMVLLNASPFQDGDVRSAAIFTSYKMFSNYGVELDEQTQAWFKSMFMISDIVATRKVNRTE